MTSVRRWAIENRTNGMPAAQKAPVRSVPVVSFSPARTAKQPHCPQKSAPDALWQIMRNVKRTAGRRVRLQIRRGLSGELHTVEITLPLDFAVGKPVRLRGLGKRVGPWQGDLYLTLYNE